MAERVSGVGNCKKGGIGLYHEISLGRYINGGHGGLYKVGGGELGCSKQLRRLGGGGRGELGCTKQLRSFFGGGFYQRVKEGRTRGVWNRAGGVLGKGVGAQLGGVPLGVSWGKRTLPRGLWAAGCTKGPGYLGCEGRIAPKRKWVVPMGQDGGLCQGARWGLERGLCHVCIAPPPLHLWP